MPFNIIRNSITKVKADAIVNTANPYPTYGRGTDEKIYMAAGADQLLREREKIGIIERGKAAVTRMGEIGNCVLLCMHCIFNYLLGFSNAESAPESCDFIFRKRSSSRGARRRN